jgi:hypothetical protein
LAIHDYARAKEAPEAALAEEPQWGAPRVTLARILEASGKRADAAAMDAALWIESNGLDVEDLARLGALDPNRADALRRPEASRVRSQRWRRGARSRIPRARTAASSTTSLEA